MTPLYFEKSVRRGGVSVGLEVDAEISAKIIRNRHFRPKIENPQMCLVGAHTAPQNLAPKSILLYQTHVKILGQKI